MGDLVYNNATLALKAFSDGACTACAAVADVAVYCKRVLNPVRIPLPEALREVEAVDVVQRYRIVSIYRPPNCSDITHDNMCKLITFLALNIEYFVIFCDFKLPGIQGPTITCPNTHAHKFVKFNINFSFNY